MANGSFNAGKRYGLDDLLAYASGSPAQLILMLVKDTYVFDADQDFIDDGTADDAVSHEITVSGYTRQALATVTVTIDDTNDVAYLDADDVVFAGLAAGQTIGGAVLFLDLGADGASVPIAFYDLEDTGTDGTDVTITWNTPANGGVLKVA